MEVVAHGSDNPVLLGRGSFTGSLQACNQSSLNLSSQLQGSLARCAELIPLGLSWPNSCGRPWSGRILMQSLELINHHCTSRFAVSTHYVFMMLLYIDWLSDSYSCQTPSKAELPISGSFILAASLQWLVWHLGRGLGGKPMSALWWQWQLPPVTGSWIFFAELSMTLPSPGSQKITVFMDVWLRPSVLSRVQRWAASHHVPTCWSLLSPWCHVSVPLSFRTLEGRKMQHNLSFNWIFI